jgi:hypothetical protein
MRMEKLSCDDILYKFVEYLVNSKITRVNDINSQFGYYSFDDLFGQFLIGLDFSIPYTQYDKIRGDTISIVRWLNLELKRRYSKMEETTVYVDEDKYE